MADHVVLLSYQSWISFFATISLMLDRSCGNFFVAIFRFVGRVFIGFFFDGRPLPFFEVMIKMYIGKWLFVVHLKFKLIFTKGTLAPVFRGGDLSVFLLLYIAVHYLKMLLCLLGYLLYWLYL